MDEAVSMLASGGTLSRDHVVLTFDDGYLGNYDHALPVLVEERVPAVVFVTTGFLDGAPLWFDVARKLPCTSRRGGRTPERGSRARVRERVRHVAAAGVDRGSGGGFEAPSRQAA
jgi:peptidoglycan/xylan/chitin deacetylase (PgdA/CDA1 family)